MLTLKVGIAFETVFSAPDKVAFLWRAKAAGYFTRVFFVGTADPSINASRIMKRFIRGGHSVPLEKIKSRYEKAMANLMPASVFADRVYIYDNSVDDQEAVLYALRKIYAHPPLWIEETIALLSQHPGFKDTRA